jgi:hypothetical protein
MADGKIAQKDDIVIKVRADIAKAQEALASLNKKAKKDYTGIANAQQKIFEKTNKLNKSLGRTPFAGYAMSIMFAGMALQRFFTSIYQFGTKAFQEISHSVEGTATKTDMLQGSMKYLGFVIGDALEPLVGQITPIIDKIAEWVEENPKLVSTLIGAGGLFGAIFMVGGMATLAYNGFSDLIRILGNTDWSSLGASVSKGVGIISIGYALKMTAEGMKELEDGSWLKGITKLTGGSFLAYGGAKMLLGKGGGPFIVIGFALELISEEIFAQTVGRVGTYVMSFFQTVAQRIEHNFSQGLWRGIASTLIDIIDYISRLNIVAQFLGLNSQAQAGLQNIRKKLKTDDFDFYKNYSDNLSTNLEGLKYLDAIISGKKEDYLVREYDAKRDQNVNYFISNMNVISNDLDQMNASINQQLG